MTGIWQKLARLIPGIAGAATIASTPALAADTDALLAKLQMAGIGQVRDRKRASLVTETH